MKIAIITDQHFGARKNSKLFHDYFLKFYNDVFFPFLEKEGITTVVDMGDTFDNRTGINFNALAWAKDNYFDRLKALGCTVHTIVGNHTAYYKNTNDINAVDLLLREYDNVKIYAETQEVKLGDTKVLFVPWINNENEEETFKKIKKSDCKVVMGHLELNGFQATAGHYMEHGMETTPFDRFEKVYSGHYHCRSVQEPVHYLGNPYEMFWGDVNDTERGFHVWDTDTFEHTPINNPYRLHHIVYYKDTDYQLFDARDLENKIVKVIVRQKSDITKFEKFIDKLYAANVAELKVVENFAIQEAEEFEAFESEDTISVLNRYIEEAEIKLDKSRVQKVLQEIYQEACELV
tara:strand:- start:330 stop:1373 length:1044 start_codon:yes stop_codon:yes gene_type:complete